MKNHPAARLVLFFGLAGFSTGLVTSGSSWMMGSVSPFRSRPGHLEDFQCGAPGIRSVIARFHCLLYCGAYRGCRGGVLGRATRRSMEASSGSPDVGVLVRTV